MDYREFQFRAVVDWLEVQVQTTQPIHYKVIRRHSGLPFVEVVNPRAEGKSATAFRLKIHDPKSWAEVVAVVTQIAEKLDLTKPFEVTAIEVALDAYARTTKEGLADLAAHFIKHTTYSHENRRLYREKKGDSFSTIGLTQSALAQYLSRSYQFGAGDKQSDCYQHSYLKTTDNNKCSLPVNEHRARTEITLRGDELPCCTLEEWANCDFSKLAKLYFTFREFVDEGGADPLQNNAVSEMNFGKLKKSLYEWSADFGKRAPRKTSKGMRLYNPNSRADSTLNDLARYALRDLAERWKTAGKQSKKATNESPGFSSQKGTACENSGDSLGVTYCNYEKQSANSNNYTIEGILNDISQPISNTGLHNKQDQ